MAGAIAGTAILHCTPSRHLDVVTVTINNTCNLACPHCYLQTAERDVFDESVIDAIVHSPCRHIAIVGKEPFASPRAIERLSRVVTAARRTGKSVSAITNGLGLRNAAPALLRGLSYLDVSFDGGRQTYASYRGGKYEDVLTGVRAAAHAGVREINALHVLSDRTIANIDDMMSIINDASFANVMFSMYVETENLGETFTRTVPLSRALHALRSSPAFMQGERAFLLIDAVDPTAQTAAQRLLAEYDFAPTKVRVIAGDPLLYGILRVTYDGLVLTPLDSLHTRRYHDRGTPLQHHADLRAAYAAFLADSDAA